MSNSTPIYNNSDDEDISNKYDDYVSFPTLPDPQQDNSQTLSKILTTTLRKVTHNASNLVTGYNSSHPNHDQVDEVKSPNDSLLALPEDTIQAPSKSEPIARVSNHDATDLIQPPTVESSIKLSRTHSEVSDSAPDTKAPVYQLDDPKALPSNPTISEVPLTPSISRDDTTAPRVTSDYKSLRLSTLIPKESYSSTSSLININATQIDTKRRPNLAKDKSLTTKISSIFNNLPNDIELSDDSGSDTETINGESPSHPSSHTSTHSLVNHKSSQANTSFPPLSYYDMSLHSDSVAESSPIKAELSGIKRNQPGTSSSLSSIYALKSKDVAMKKKTSSNLSNLIIGNARSIINNNIVSSASSIMTNRSREREKRKKKKPKRPSNNPLKNGGIPRKYWMNDSFVSDCLNCFKPFTAFRRKHHCRFCGQIFCSDCTLFISYNQHKEERRNGGPSKKVYNDKLRVCKPCYSDVIVYLSDDSTSSEDEEEKKEESNMDSKLSNDDISITQSRGRSMSMSSKISEYALRHANSASTDSYTRGEAFGYPLEVKTNPKQAPQMAIPATRAGEAVEIPIPKNSYSNSVVLNDIYNPTKYNHLQHHLQSQYSHAGTPTNTSHGGNGGPSKSWLKNYNHLLPSSLSSPDLNRSGSLDNLSHLYPNLIGRKTSQGKFRIKSGSEKDLFHLQTGNPYDYSSARDNRLIESESNESYSDDENSNQESENEDEQAMSLYKSLTLSGYNTNSKVSSRNLGSSSSNVVPTLREFPNMQSTDIPFPRYPGIVTASVFPKFINNATTPTNSNQKKQISFLEDHPQSEYLRSHERANASLIRMRSRRKSKSSRHVSILTQNNYRLPSFDRSNQTNSPTLSPGSPVLNQQITTPKGNFSTVSREKENTLDPAFDTQLSPINNRSQKTLDTEVSQDLADIEDNEDFEVSSYMINDEENIKEDTNMEELVPQDKLHDDLLQIVLKQCLADCDIEDDMDEWISVIQNSLEKINHIKLTDTLDIRQYVKIKKIYGGKIKQTHVLEGLFFTKNIDSRRMPSSLRNPKIALLMFPIEYLKQKDQFISLRIIHSQQNVYITNLVSRLISMEPDIVVVGDTVCGLAISLLEEAGITVISNVKPQIIERISRYTKADIFQSVNDLFFKKCILGECSNFEIRKYSYENMVKTFSFFIGTDISSGFTICLRGGNEDLLNSVKYAAETLMPGYLNAKFERSLFEDHNVSLISGPKNEEVEEINRSLEELASDDSDREAELQLCEYSLENTEVLNYVKLFNERVLSVSPAVEYTLPSPLINVITSYLKFHNYFKTNQIIQDLSSNDSVDKSLLDSFQINFKELPQESDLLAYLKFASENRLVSLKRNYESRIRIWSNCMTYPTYQLYPIFHRSIQVLHSCVSIKHATPCTGPNTVVIDYYTDNDKCLGLFLDQIFQESPRICQECGDSMLNHYKTYAHGNAKLDVIIEKFDISSDQHDYPSKNQRVMWSTCKICNYSTPIVPMHDETYYLSIGKFLELSFYGENATVNHPSCNHPFFKNHIRFFSLNNIVIRMEYSHIDTYEVVVPKKQLEFVSELDINLKIDVMNSIQKKSKVFFRSIFNRLNRVKVDTYAKAEEGLQKIEELKQLLESQIHNIRTKTNEIYNTCAPDSYISLNTVLRDLQELGVAWDKEFTDFEEKFLPSEVEITKITQFHLRNFLLDKYNESEMDKTETSSTMKEPGKPDPDQDEPTQDSVQTKNNSSSSASSTKTSNESAYDLPSLNREQTKEIGSMIPSSLYDQSNFTERISMWKEFTSKDVSSTSGSSKPVIQYQNSSSSLASQNDKGSNSTLNKSRSFTNTTNTTVNTSKSNDMSISSSATNSKVHQLASFFDRMNIDQISMEFRKQREQELQKKTKNQFIANPIVESKPIVEIYDNIEEAVDVHAESKKHKTAVDEKNPVKRIDDVNDEKSHITNNTSKTLDIPQPERQSLLKSLTNFWADRSATLWDPLKYVLESDEHTFADSEVIVREDEPSSLVAFCLSTSDYKQKIKTMEQEQDGEMLGDSLEENDLDNKKLQNFIKIEKKFKQNYIDSSNINPLEKIMIKRKSNHLKYQFNDGSANLSCKIFYSEQFEALRKSCGNNDNFVQSLSRCIKWDSQGGKSRSSFLKTLDNRYIVKELSPSELESFVALAPFYFRYISQSIFDNLSSAIAKIFGFYQIEIKNTLTGKTFKMDFLIMENLFYNHNTTRIFDLKGSMRNRHVQQTGKQDEVLLDENMIEYIYESPVFVKEHSKKLLRGSLFNDTSFLSAMDVMDYSLVVGIDDSSHKLYIGIIDWLRTFTWDKKVENWVKGNNLIGGNKRGKDPTIVTPKQYRTRFREAMERYILEVPDIWYEGSNQVV